LREKAQTIPEAVQCASACDDEAMAALKSQLDDLRSHLNQAK
jgi:hypothetical protein